MTAIIWPDGISRQTVADLLSDARTQKQVLEQISTRFERKYDSSLAMLEARLARGEGSEYPDWEDSIEWRNAVEMLDRQQKLQGVLEWMLRSIVPSLTS